MKLRLTLLALLPFAVHAEEGDKQSMMRVSSTDPLTITSSSAVRSPQLPSTQQTRGVRIASTVDAHCKPGGVSVTATISDTLFPAKTPEYIKIPASDGNYVSCIADNATGKVWIDPASSY